jgi:hypothetical protein
LNLDTCAGGVAVGRFRVWESHNVGSYHHPILDCVQPAAGGKKFECFWSTGSVRFGGWQAYSSGQLAGDPYRRFLKSIVANCFYFAAGSWWCGPDDPRM